MCTQFLYCYQSNDEDAGAAAAQLDAKTEGVDQKRDSIPLWVIAGTQQTRQMDKNRLTGTSRDKELQHIEHVQD